MDEVFGLFPTPFMRAPATLDAALLASLIDHFAALATRDNNSSRNLAHTEMLRPDDSPLFARAAERSPRRTASPRRRSRRTGRS